MGEDSIEFYERLFDGVSEPEGYVGSSVGPGAWRRL